MRLEVLTSSEELGRGNYRQVMNGVFIHEKLGRVLVFDKGDTGFKITLPGLPSESQIDWELEAAILATL